MYFIDKPGEEFENFLAWLNGEQIYAIDTETTGLDPHTDKVLLIQVGNAEKQWVIDTYRMKKHIKFVFQYLTNPNKIKILHNAQFDYKMLLGHYGIKLNNLRCTMLAEQLLTKGKLNTITTEGSDKVTQKKISASLAAVVKKYKNITLDKEERITFIEMAWGDKFTEDQIKYSGLDVAYLIDIFKDQDKFLKERGMEQLAELEFEAISVFGDMSYNGIYLDKKKWLPLEALAIKQSEVYLDRLNEHFKDYIEAKSEEDLFGKKVYAINYNSPKQVLQLLRDVTGVLLDKTDAKYLEEFKNKHPAISDLVSYKKEQKKISTYGSTFLDYIHPETGRIHSDFKQIFADTGRTSSEDPNMQNLPKQQEYRTPFCVKDKENYRFISADFSGQVIDLLLVL